MKVRGQVRDSGHWLLHDFIRSSLILFCHIIADLGAQTRFGLRCVAEESGRGAVSVVGFRGDDAVDLPAKKVAELHHKGQQEADDDVEGHHAEKDTG